MIIVFYRRFITQFLFWFNVVISVFLVFIFLHVFVPHRHKCQDYHIQHHQSSVKEEVIRLQKIMISRSLPIESTYLFVEYFGGFYNDDDEIANCTG
jgi:hypothetical protein